MLGVILSPLRILEEIGKRDMPKQVGIEVGEFVISVLTLLMCLLLVLLGRATMTEIFPIVTLVLGIYTGRRLKTKLQNNGGTTNETDDE